ncbi:MAG TPA: hypothetical protein VLM11_22510 [Streptosporangiaceae bacterium]|nr:hypothetical protein [Streptosporangiaceae bacterium]
MDPQIKFFETACVTDNSTGQIITPDEAQQHPQAASPAAAARTH